MVLQSGEEMEKSGLGAEETDPRVGVWKVGAENLALSFCTNIFN